MALIQINNVSKAYLDKTILKDINFNIEKKDKIGLIGLNGVGKSSIIKMILFLFVTHELHFHSPKLHLRRSKIAEHRQMGLLAQPLLQGLGHFNAATHHHHVDVVGRPFEKKVANIATHNVTFQLQGIGHGG